MLFNNQAIDMTSTIDGNNNVVDQDMNIDINMNSNSMGMNQNNMEMMDSASPIIEPVQEREINRTFVHQVPHVCPIHTRIINHHIYKHTYCPRYTCCEENVCCNIDQGSCCNFR